MVWAVAVKVFSSMHDMVRDVVDQDITCVDNPSIYINEMCYIIKSNP